MLSKRRELWWGLAATALSLVLFFVFAALGWPGEPSGCTRSQPDTCFCERYIRAGELVKQPANTWGNLGFITVGLVILWRVGSDRTAPIGRRNPMTDATPYAILYGATVIFLGPGSMFFHGSMTRWGNWIDTFSMILYGAFGLLYAISRSFRLPWRVFFTAFLGLTSSLGIYSWFVRGTGTPIFIVLVALWILSEFAIWRFKPNNLHRDPPLFLAALGVFALALVIWWFSQTGRLLCDPESLLQGHAIWHLLSAVVAGIIFMYLRTERR